MRTRTIGGVKWTCVEPGHWTSNTAPVLHAHCVMDGTMWRQWEVYDNDLTISGCMLSAELDMVTAIKSALHQLNTEGRVLVTD